MCVLSIGRIACMCENEIETPPCWGECFAVLQRPEWKHPERYLSRRRRSLTTHGGASSYRSTGACFAVVRRLNNVCVRRRRRWIRRYVSGSMFVVGLAVEVLATRSVCNGRSNRYTGQTKQEMQRTGKNVFRSCEKSIKIRKWASKLNFIFSMC